MRIQRLHPLERHERMLRGMTPTGLRGTMLSERAFGPKRRYSYEVPDECEPVETLLWLNMFAAASGNISGLAFDGTDLWQLDTIGHALIRTDVDDGSTLDTFTLSGLLGGQSGLAFDGTDLWITHNQGVDPHLSELRRYSTSGALQQTITLDHGNYAGPAWDGSHLWVTDGYLDLVKRIDPDAGVVVDSFSPPGAGAVGTTTYNASPIGYDADTGYLWFNGVNRSLYVTDLSGTLVATYLTPWTDSSGITLFDGGVWMSSPNNDRIYRADVCQ